MVAISSCPSLWPASPPRWLGLVPVFVISLVSLETSLANISHVNTRREGMGVAHKGLCITGGTSQADQEVLAHGGRCDREDGCEDLFCLRLFARSSIRSCMSESSPLLTETAAAADCFFTVVAFGISPPRVTFLVLLLARVVPPFFSVGWGCSSVGGSSSSLTDSSRGEGSSEDGESCGGVGVAAIAATQCPVSSAAIQWVRNTRTVHRRSHGLHKCEKLES